MSPLKAHRLQAVSKILDDNWRLTRKLRLNLRLTHMMAARLGAYSTVLAS